MGGEAARVMPLAVEATTAAFLFNACTSSLHQTCSSLCLYAYTGSSSRAHVFRSTHIRNSQLATHKSHTRSATQVRLLKRAQLFSTSPHDLTLWPSSPPSQHGATRWARITCLTCRRSPVRMELLLSHHLLLPVPTQTRMRNMSNVLFVVTRAVANIMASSRVKVVSLSSNAPSGGT